MVDPTIEGLNMASVLQKKILDYLDKSGLSVAALERKAGLKTNVARNILRGQSKRPTAVTLQALAEILGCQVKDLLEGRSESTTIEGSSDEQRALIVDYPEVLKDCLDSIIKISIEHTYRLSVKQTLFIMEEAYLYGIKKDPPSADTAFIKWIIDKTIS
jgi:transcriptional regulator with XRE-family HTH domain